MKVLVISNLYPSRREPTRGMFHYNIFRALAEHCEVRMIAPLPWWTRLRHPADILRTPQDNSSGILVEYPTYWSIPRMTSLHSAGMYASIRGRVARLRREFPFDVIMSAWAYPDGVVAARLARDFNCPVVAKVLGSDINDTARQPRLRRMISESLQQSATVLAVSHALKERVAALGVDPARILVHHNGVNGDVFRIRDRMEVRASLGLPTDRRLITYVGNFRPVKGVDVLMDAFIRLARERNDVNLVMLGGGPLESSLHAAVEAAGISDRVLFPGRKPQVEVADWMAATDIFCLPSRLEGCPNVVLEGLASGRPVVATAVGGVPELIHDGNGILAPSEDPVALAGTLGCALDTVWDPQALRDSVEYLSWGDISAALAKVLEDAVREHAAKR